MAMMGGGFGPRDDALAPAGRLGDQGTLSPGTVRRIVRYARPFSRHIVAFLTLVAVGSVIVIADPLLLKAIIDDGIIPQRSGVVIGLALVRRAAWRSSTRLLGLAQRWYSVADRRGPDLRPAHRGLRPRPAAAASPSSSAPRPARWSPGSTATSSARSGASPRRCPRSSPT